MARWPGSKGHPNWLQHKPGEVTYPLHACFFHPYMRMLIASLHTVVICGHVYAHVCACVCMSRVAGIPVHRASQQGHASAQIQHGTYQGIITPQ